MAKVVNIIGSGSNVGKTYIMEGIIKELKSRGLSIATIKHDVHGFDIDKEGKDTYKHRKAGSETVIISSKNRLAMIKELKEETGKDALFLCLDLADLKSIKIAAEEFLGKEKELHILFNNACVPGFTSHVFLLTCRALQGCHVPSDRSAYSARIRPYVRD